MRLQINIPEILGYQKCEIYYSGTQFLGQPIIRTGIKMEINVREATLKYLKNGGK